MECVSRKRSASLKLNLEKIYGLNFRLLLFLIFTNWHSSEREEKKFRKIIRVVTGRISFKLPSLNEAILQDTKFKGFSRTMMCRYSSVYFQELQGKT